ncbi:ribosomal protein L1, partial [Ramicandelaber brevisporus]
ILVFAEGEAAKAALDAGATVVGGEELIQAIQNGQDPLQYTKVISTLALYPAVTKIARILGPRGLMPSMRDGTVTANVANVVAASLGATEFKANRAGYIRIPLGPIALTTEQIRANVNAIVDTLEPHLKAAKKLEVTGVFLKSTNGPDLRIRDF